MSAESIEFRLASLERNQRQILDMLKALMEERRQELPALMTQRQVLNYLKTSRQTLLRLTEDGMLHPMRKEGATRNTTVRYKSSEVIKLRGINS